VNKFSFTVVFVKLLYGCVT